MTWYATEPVIASDQFFRLDVALENNIPLVRELAARRFMLFVESKGKERDFYDFIFSAFVHRHEPTYHRDILRGIQEGLSGRRTVPAPKAWKDAYPILIESPLPEVRERALALAVQFGDERAFTLLRKIVPDRALAVKQREDALKTLLFQQKPDLVPILHDLLSDEALRGPAIRGLAAFDDAKTPRLLLELYPRLNTDEKADAIQTLASRGPYALALLNALGAKTIPRGDINSYTIRQLQTVKQPELAAKIAKVWGEVRPASADKVKLMAKYKAELTPATLKKANLANGRALYAKSCASCHRLFGEGGDIGPDLTGSQRTNLDYVLENVLDPSAIVPKEYQVTVVVTMAGRTLSGIVKKESDAALTLQLPNEVVVLPKGEIESRTPTKVSMMPEGIFEPLRLEEVRDLVAYLASPVQVALKK
jgi:putative heme-binding domain-containing protein